MPTLHIGIFADQKIMPLEQLGLISLLDVIGKHNWQSLIYDLLFIKCLLHNMSAQLINENENEI